MDLSEPDDIFDDVDLICGWRGTMGPVNFFLLLVFCLGLAVVVVSEA
jgi:hypothetical protein